MQVKYLGTFNSYCQEISSIKVTWVSMEPQTDFISGPLDKTSSVLSTRYSTRNAGGSGGDHIFNSNSERDADDAAVLQGASYRP